MPALKPLLFLSNYAGDAPVIADLLRAYGYHLSDDDMGIADTTPRLQVTWQPQTSGPKLVWTEQGRSWTHQEEMILAPFAETEENRRRRTLRLAFHHLLMNEPGFQELAQIHPGTWGVLTGVRPSKMVHRFIDQGMGDEAILHALDNSFGVAESRAQLLVDVCHRQRPFLPSVDEGRKQISLYLCFPFCPSRCAYCSFPGYDLQRWKKWLKPCLDAMAREMQGLGEHSANMGFQVESVYFGGGTPTCMPAEEMDRLLTLVEDAFVLAPGLEWTIEGGRPETLTREVLDVLARHPVNRLCVNPQSMHQETLDTIGRHHQVEEVDAAFQRIRDTMVGGGRQNWRINCDLILGLPGEGLDQVRESLAHVLSLQPDNVTLHGLAIKRGSVYKETEEGLPGIRLGLAMVDETREMLLTAGYEPYYLYRQKDSLAGGENVGYTLPGSQCVYNIRMIEERQTILGLGVGAGSKFLRPGSWLLENKYNPKDLVQYIERLDELVEGKIDKLTSVW